MIIVNNDGSLSTACYFKKPEIDYKYRWFLRWWQQYLPEDEEPFILDQETLYELVEPETFIGMHSPPNAIEPFYVAEVKNKVIANKKFW